MLQCGIGKNPATSLHDSEGGGEISFLMLEDFGYAEKCFEGGPWKLCKHSIEQDQRFLVLT